MATLFNSLYRAPHHGHSVQEHKAHRLKHNFKEDKARVSRERTPSLPKLRYRLSQATLRNQPQPLSNLFYRLPLELRQRIYFFVYSDQVFHLSLLKNSIVHPRLDIRGDSDDNTGSVPLIRPPKPLEDERGVPVLGQSDANSLALLRTCHAIYSEAISLVYSLAVFSIDSPLTLVYMHDYTLLRQRFQAIRHLRLRWLYDEFKHRDGYEGHPFLCPPLDKGTWSRFWTLVAGMQLESLSVSLLHFGMVEDIDMERDWMRPLSKVKGVKEVGVRVENMTSLGVERLRSVEDEILRRWTS